MNRTFVKSLFRSTSLRKWSSVAVTVSLLGAGVAGAVGLTATAASAASTTTIVGAGDVAPANPNGAWALANTTGTYSFVAGPATPPGGTGSLALGIASGGHEALYNYSYGICSAGPACTTPVTSWTTLASITALGFSTYRASGTTYPTLNVEADVSGTGADYTSFVFIPTAAMVANTTWQAWDAMNPADGTWFSTANIGSGPFDCNFQAAGCSASWAQIVAAYPLARVKYGLGPNVGSGGTFAGNVDDFTVGVSGATTVYDFEPSCTTTCYVNASTGRDAATGLSTDPFKTIQEGVNAVTAGGTVAVAAGTYRENVTVPKGVDISGAGAGSTIVEPATSNPTCAPGDSGSLCSPPTDVASSVFLVQSSNVTIDHLTVDGHNPALSGVTVGGVVVAARNGIVVDFNAAPGLFNNLSVHNVTVQNVYLRGIYASSGGTFNFTDDTVTNVQGDPAESIALFNYGGSGVMTGNTVSDSVGGIYSNHSTGTTYTNNTVTASGSGVESDNNGDSGGTPDVISGNQVSACTAGGYGLTVFVPYLGVTVDNNTVSGCDVGMAALASCDLGGTNNCPGGVIPSTTYSDNNVTTTATGVGFYATTNSFGFGDGEVHATGDHNTISGAGTGVYVEEDQSANPAHATVAVNRNSLNNVTNAGTTTVDATCNWWGQSSGPAAGQVTGNVTVSTSLATSNLNGPCATASATVTSVALPEFADALVVSFVPGNNGGSAFTSFTATCTSPGQATGTASGSGSPITVEGLVPDKAYLCSVTETNAVGTSPSSNSVLGFPGAAAEGGGGGGTCTTLPSAPTNLSTAPGNASATVSWTPPANGCVAGYIVTPYLGTVAQTPVLISGPGTTTVVSGLVNGETYQFRVAAENGVAAGAASAPSASVTVGAPTAASVSHVVRVAKGVLQVAFTKPAKTNGAAISKYTATCVSSNGGVARSKAGKSSPLTVSGLTPGKTYSCTVRATNSRGTGPASHASAHVKA